MYLNKKTQSQIVGGKSVPMVQFEDPFSTFVNIYMKNIYNKTKLLHLVSPKGKLPQDFLAAFNLTKKCFQTMHHKGKFLKLY